MDRYNRYYRLEKNEFRDTKISYFLDKENNDYVSFRYSRLYRFRHNILGTDGIGRDLFSGLIHGTKISLMVGLVSMGIIGFIGIIFLVHGGFLEITN